MLYIVNCVEDHSCAVWLLGHESCNSITGQSAWLNDITCQNDSYSRDL